MGTDTAPFQRSMELMALVAGFEPSDNELIIPISFQIWFSQLILVQRRPAKMAPDLHMCVWEGAITWQRLVEIRGRKRTVCLWRSRSLVRSPFTHNSIWVRDTPNGIGWFGLAWRPPLCSSQFCNTIGSWEQRHHLRAVHPPSPPHTHTVTARPHIMLQFYWFLHYDVIYKPLQRTVKHLRKIGDMSSSSNGSDESPTSGQISAVQHEFYCTHLVDFHTCFY